MPTENTVVIEVPLTLRVSIDFPAGAPRDPQAEATALAGWVAGKLAHVSHAQIDACNELNRLFPHGTGVVTEVDTLVHPTAGRKAAA